MSSEGYKDLLPDISILFDELKQEKVVDDAFFQKPLFPKSGIHFFHRRKFKKPPIKINGVHFLDQKQQDDFRKHLEAEKKEHSDALKLGQRISENPEQNIADEMDVATVQSEKEIQMDKQERRQERIMLIEMALKRLDEQTYGYCLETGKPIEIGRLKADPAVTLCLESQCAREEKEHLALHSSSSFSTRKHK